MADGNGPDDNKFLQNFPYAPNGAVVSTGDFGASCDPLMRNLRARLLAYRHAMGIVRATRTGGGDFLISGGQAVTLFSTGSGDSAFGGTLTDAETNALPKGGLVEVNQRFVSVGMSVQLLRPWAVATGAALLGPRLYPAWMRNSGTPGGYDVPLLDALAEATSMEVRHGTSPACKYDAGVLSMQTAVAGAKEVSTSVRQAGDITYFAISDESGGQQANDQVTVTLTVNWDLTIGADTVPVPTGFEAACPFRVLLWGAPFCAMDAQTALILKMQAEIDAMKQSNGQKAGAGLPRRQ